MKKKRIPYTVCKVIFVLYNNNSNIINKKIAGHSFTTTYSKSGILINMVRLESAIDTNVADNGFLAQWDTGATCSAITERVVQKLCLQPVSRAMISTPSGKRDCNQYYVNVCLPNRVRVQNVLVTEGLMVSCDILIGMDIIGLGDFAVSNFNGETSFSFRMPSVGIIDFVNNSYNVPIKNQIKIGRNDLCPCKSGLKYKKCCGKNK